MLKQKKFIAIKFSPSDFIPCSIRHLQACRKTQRLHRALPTSRCVNQYREMSQNKNRPGFPGRLFHF
jgi:hypothetical protein